MEQEHSPNPQEMMRVYIYWAFNDSGREIPKINIAEDETEIRDLVFDRYNVSSVGELADEFRNSPVDSEVGVGVIWQDEGGFNFRTTRERLQWVDEIDGRTADAILHWWSDIKSLCKELQRSGNAAIGDAVNDLDTVEGNQQYAAALLRWGERVDSVERSLHTSQVWVESGT